MWHGRGITKLCLLMHFLVRGKILTHIFPPFSLIAKILQRIQGDKAQMIVIVPSVVVHRVPRTLDIKESHTTSTKRRSIDTSTPERLSASSTEKELTLTSGRLSGMPTERAFRILISSWKSGTHKHYSYYFISDSGMDSVLKEKLVVLDHL